MLASGLAALLALAAPLAAQGTQPTGPVVRVTALGENASAALGTQTGETVGGQAELFLDEPLLLAVEPPEGEPGERRGIFRVAAAGLTLVLDGVDVEIAPREDGGLRLKLIESSAGTLDIYHERETPTLLIEGTGFSIGLPRGALRIVRSAAGAAVEISASDGRASLIPTGRDGLVLDAAGANRVSIAADGAAASPARAEGAAQAMASLRRGLVQRSLLPDLVRVAEAVAEGDIEPPTRGAAIAAAAVAPEVRISEIVPRGGTTSRLAAGGAQVGGAGAAASTAEAFIRTGQAALAVVGARLQRTRIIGATVGRTLTVNPQLSRPFSLGRR